MGRNKEDTDQCHRSQMGKKGGWLFLGGGGLAWMGRGMTVRGARGGGLEGCRGGVWSETLNKFSRILIS